MRQNNINKPIVFFRITVKSENVVPIRNSGILPIDHMYFYRICINLHDHSDLNQFRKFKLKDTEVAQATTNRFQKHIIL